MRPGHLLALLLLLEGLLTAHAQITIGAPAVAAAALGAAAVGGVGLLALGAVSSNTQLVNSFSSATYIVLHFVVLFRRKEMSSFHKLCLFFIKMRFVPASRFSHLKLKDKFIFNVHGSIYDLQGASYHHQGPFDPFKSGI